MFEGEEGVAVESGNFFFGPGNREREMEVERRRMRRSLEL
jgi:hypothetical protein